MKNVILQGNALDVLKTLPDESVDMCITSPPYWALRDYGVEGQLGLEPTFQEYIDSLCDIFDEVKRVLKKEGTCWANIGDTYSGNSSYSGKGRAGYEKKDGNTKEWLDPKLPARIRGREMVDMSEIKNKSLVQIPSRFAIEMTNRGWILRNEIIWHKPNAMPSSVEDRFTVDFEKIFFFTKQKKYYFEQQKEPYTEPLNRWGGEMVNRVSGSDEYGIKDRIRDYRPDKEGKNKRAVWKIPTKPYPEAHFAVYPSELIETPIKAGCPEFVCKKCGKARETIVKSVGLPRDRGVGKLVHIGQQDGRGHISGEKLRKWKEEHPDEISLTDCGCHAGFEGGVVLDPFIGSGTTAVVARDLDRQYIGIELNPEYIKLIDKRLAQQKLL